MIAMADQTSAMEGRGGGTMTDRLRGARLVPLLVLMIGTACAPIWAPIDEKTPRPFAMTTIEMTMDLPVGWMSSYYAPAVGYFFFTVHGEELEEIWIRRWPKVQIVKGTNRNLSGPMTIQEMANLSIDSRRLDDGVGAFEVVSNRPATLDGRDCYRLDYRYRNQIGLPKRTVEYGCPVGTWFYRFEFNAPEQFYFGRRLEDFERMTKTIHFTTKGG